MMNKEPTLICEDCGASAKRRISFGVLKTIRCNWCSSFYESLLCNNPVFHDAELDRAKKVWNFTEHGPCPKV